MSKINIMALRHSAFYSPLLMTMAGNFLKEQGLEPEYTLAHPDRTVPDSILNGGCHVAQSAVSTSFLDLERNNPIDIVHFAQINSRDGFFIAAREPDNAFSWNKLKGKQVLVDHFFQPMAMFKYALHKQGIDFNSLDIIDAGDVNGIEEAFRSGIGDYVHQQGPAPQQMEKEGIGYVVASVGEVVGPVAFSSLCATREWCESDMAQAFMRAYTKSLQFVLDSPAAIISRLEYEAGFFPEVDFNVLTNTIQVYKELGCWQPDPVISAASYENLLDIFLFSGLITQRHAYHKTVVRPPSG